MIGMKKLNAKQRRNIILGGAVVLFAIAAFALSRPGVLTNQAPPVNAGNLLGNADTHALGIASINTDISKTNTSVGDLKQQVDNLERQNRALADSKNTATTPTLVAGPQIGNGSPAFPNQSLAPPVPTVTPDGVNTPNGYVGANGMPGGGAGVGGAPDIKTVGGGVAEKTSNGMTSSSDSSANETSGDTSAADATPKKPKDQTPKVFIPAGTMLTGVLITGLDAPTGREAAAQPIPLLVRVKEEAILPNEYRADYRECFIVASGVGDLSSERAYLRGETLSCIANNGGVIQAHLQMWGTGEDGKAGMRGKLVSKQGSILAKAMLAGFASGLGQAFTPQQQTMITTNGSGYGSIPIGTAGRMAAMGGVSSGANQIAQYYLKMAESEFPVIEISAGRPVTFIVEKGASLSKLEETK